MITTARKLAQQSHSIWLDPADGIDEWIVSDRVGDPWPSDDCLGISNWKTAQEAMAEFDERDRDGEGDWDIWKGTIIAKPETEAAHALEEMDRSLEDYPVLDESDWSEREHEDVMRQWEDYGEKDFADALVSRFDLGWLADDDDTAFALTEHHSDKLAEWVSRHSHYASEHENDWNDAALRVPAAEAFTVCLIAAATSFEQLPDLARALEDAQEDWESNS